MVALFAFVALFATTIGAISGVGGGIIIKPVLDAVGGLPVATTNFMSSCTVFSMAAVSIYRGRKDKLDIDYKISTALALGACLGGVLGKIIFDIMPNNQAFIQSFLLLIINILIYVYIKFKAKIHTCHCKNLFLCGIIGCGLGTMSSFLGIGGGPMNVVVLQYFFSTTPKITAKRSIFVILLSQISGLTSVFLKGVPDEVNYLALFLMMFCGCMGAILGGKISKKLTEAQIDDFFTDVLVGIIVINAYNMGSFSG